jgi:hypothetical protein
MCRYFGNNQVEPYRLQIVNVMQAAIAYFYEFVSC